MIDMIPAANGFAFYRRTTRIGLMPYDTMVPQITDEKVTPDEQWYIDYYAKEHVAGEMFKLGKTVIVLGPLREFTHEVVVHAVGNPDHRQFADIAPRTVVRVCGIEEAQKVVREYQTRNEMGGGNCSKEHGTVWALPVGGKGRRKKVGEVSYNGRYWTVAEKAAWEAEIKAKYAK